MLDDLYWVMSYSRWKDERFFPAFRDGFIAQHAQIDAAGLEKAKAYNAQRYFYQGIGRYAPDEAYARGLADLRALAELVPAQGFLHGAKPSQHRRRDLWVHRQHLFLSDSDAAEGVR